MRVHIKRVCLVLLWLSGIIIFINMKQFYSNYKSRNKLLKEIESETRSSTVNYVNLSKSYTIHSNLGMKVDTENMFRNVHMTRRNNYFSQTIRKNDKIKQRENNQLQQQRGPCNLTKFHSHLKSRETYWQQVNHDNSMYVFSAYLTRSTISIIGVKPRSHVRVICQLWTSSEDEYIFVTKETIATVEYAVSDGSTEKYTSTIFKCPIKQLVPTHVSLVIESCDTPLNLLQVQDVTTTARQYQDQFTVCLSPLNFRYGRAYELIEWIELNRILGADKFVVYNYSSAINVAQVLDYYTKINTTEVIQWRLPMGVDTFPKTNEPKEIHYFGQTAALNDCLFRSKKTSRYVVNLDVDEFIIPHSVQTNTWYDIINQLGTASVYMFQNTFFRKDWDKLEIDFTKKDIVDKLRLVTLQVFQHETKIFTARLRSKYIARTSNVKPLMIHEVPGAQMLTVPIDIGLLHHYRNWENPNDKIEWVNDTTILEKFKTSLIDNVQNVWKILSHVKMDIPIV